MNLLKSKLGIFSLLAVFGISLFLTSCNKNDDEPSPQQATAPVETDILLPRLANESEMADIVENATEKEMIGYRNNFIIYDYVSKIGKLEDVIEGTPDSFSFNLDKLDATHKAEVESLLLDEDDRGCAYVGVYVCAWIPTGFCWYGPCNWRKLCAGASGWVCW